MRSIKKNTILVIIVVLAVIIGADLRFKDLEKRPMHTDEAVQAERLGNLIENNEFEYNPKDGHGPGLLYLSLPITWLKKINNYQGLNETTLRMVPAFYGTLLIISMLLFKRLIGSVGVAVAALLVALSPMHVYYSRYFIMEIPLIILLSLFLFCCWKYFCDQRFRWMLCAGLCCAFMHSIKETFIISVTALTISYVILFIWEEITKRKGARLQTRPLIKNTAISLSVTLLVSAALYSLFFTNIEAIEQSFLTYFDYIKRAEGSGHEKPFWYYIQLLTWKKMELYTWSELFIISLAIIGAVSSFTIKGLSIKEQIFIRSLSLYTVITLGIYSSINYKTPETLGNDRLAGIVGANKEYPNNNILVIDAGSCITFDFFMHGKYCGGKISPGLQMRYDALHTFTNQLPQISISDTHFTFGNDTNSSIISGVQQGAIDEMDTVIDTFRKENKDTVVILTGGDCFFFEKALKNSIFANPFLVMEGLNEILDYNE